MLERFAVGAPPTNGWTQGRVFCIRRGRWTLRRGAGGSGAGASLLWMEVARVPLLVFAFAAVAAFDDAVHSLPTYGALAQKQYAGFAPVTDDGANQLHYWFVECDKGNAPGTPLLMWLNGGPGASSLTGLLAEKLGPQSITANGTLVDNPDRITKKYHLITLDNPVGSGYSQTSSGRYVSSEAMMRTQAVQALRVFFSRHPEYAPAPSTRPRPHDATAKAPRRDSRPFEQRRDDLRTRRSARATA